MLRSPGLLVVLSFLCLRNARAVDFVVTTINDSGPGSLRQAITDANATPGPDRILFNLPGSGMQTISLLSPLPNIIDALVIDGYTQPGASANTLASGDNAVLLVNVVWAGGENNGNPVVGFQINASQSVIRGLSISSFNTQSIGDTSSTAVGVSGGSNNAVEGCSITNNFNGISLTGGTTTVGGTLPDKRNIISDNTAAGILSSADGTAIAGNYIGTDPSGVHYHGNFGGVVFFGSHTKSLIGGTSSGAANLISNNHTGVSLGVLDSPYGGPISQMANGIVVQGNLIGLTADGSLPHGNANGIVVNGSNNLIGGTTAGAGNVIAFSSSGVSVRSGVGNSILSNSIYSNYGIGLELGEGAGVVANDPQDADTGPNDLQNFPIIDSTELANGQAKIGGHLNSTPNSRFTIQFFAEAGDLRGIQTYIGSTTVTTSASGDGTFAVTLAAPGSTAAINATATNANGDTSEFFLDNADFKNISTRGRVGTGENVMIAGFIPGPRGRVAVRALGPTLTGRKVAGVLADPTLEVYQNGTLLVSNDNWTDDKTSAAALQADGLAPMNSSEAAYEPIDADHGDMTVVIRGKNDTSGVGLVEVYDLSTSSVFSSPRISNLSTRGYVGPGDDVLIGGIIIGGGGLPGRVLARALGPSLVNRGVVHPLPDPLLELHDGNGNLLGQNDNWRDTEQADFLATGWAMSMDDAESAILMRVLPGAYTAIVRGKGDATGVALVEFYNLR